ncbi:MAG: RidA family protein, partial [Chloroflexota bacterium]
MPRKTIYLPGPTTQDSTQHHLVPEAVVVGDMLFTGGIAGADPVTGRLPATNEEQAALAYDRLEIILAEAGYSKDQVAHWFIWAPDRHTQISPVNPHCERWFPNPQSRPARHALSRQLDPGQHYRIEIVGVKTGARRAYEINSTVYHTGGSATPGFMPFGANVGDILFTGPTYGMYAANRTMGETALKQAELCRELNADLFKMAGFTEDNITQM